MAKSKITKKTETFSLDALFEKFLTEKQVMGSSQATLTTYRDTFKSFRRYTDANEINKDVVMGYISYLTEQYTSVSSVNHHIRDIRAFIYYGFENGLDCIPFKISIVKGQEEIKPPYSDEECARLLAKPSDNCSFSEYRNWIIVQTLLATGIRASTLLNVQLKDVCLSSKHLILSHTKNKKAQILPLSTTLCKNLGTYISLYRDENNPESYLFPNVYDEPMKYSALRLAIARFNNDRGVENTSIHGFRRTFAKQFIMNGGSAMVLQQMLGHSSMEMTKRYVALYSNDLSKDFDDYCPLESMMPKSKKHIVK